MNPEDKEEDVVIEDDVFLLDPGPCAKCKYLQDKFDKLNRAMETISVDMQRARNLL